MKRVNQDGIIYLINEDNSTSSIIKYLSSTGNAFIPRSINYESKEYLVTSITSGSFEKSKLQSITFSPDSELQEIERKAFSNTLIESITIPSHLKKIGPSAFEFCQKLKKIEIPENSELQKIEEFSLTCTSVEELTIPSKLIELKEGFCTGKSKLTKLNVMPNNSMYRLFQNKIIVGKSNPQNEHNDVILFARRDVKYIFVPSFIKRIGAFSINCCDKLFDIEIQNNSELQTIELFSFCASSIRSIKIPKTVTYIGVSAFDSCVKLDKVLIPSDSKLQKIKESAFRLTGIHSIYIPKCVEKIGNSAFERCFALRIIEFAEYSEIENISPDFFNEVTNLKIMIPFQLSNRLNL